MSAAPRIETLGQLRPPSSRGEIAAARSRTKSARTCRSPAPEADAVSRHHRLRRHRRSAADQRDPVASSLHPARTARPGEDAHPAGADDAARRVAAGRPGQRDQRRPAGAALGLRPPSRRRAEGDDLPIAWLPREARYIEKLATPDVTIADMIGDIDPIKAAKTGLQLGNELAMHFGLLPRANRGIFAINELPDLAGKIQVGLFNILQEGDVQIKGYPVRLPLDVMVGLLGQPRGLHRARQDHHAAQGPHRRRDPHPLPRRAAPTRWRSPRRKRGPIAAATCRFPPSCARRSRSSPSRRARIAAWTSARASASACRSACSKAWSRTPSAARWPPASHRSCRASSTSTPRCRR